MFDKELLATHSRSYGIQLTDEQLTLFLSYAKILLDWNSRINLTAITNYNDIIDKHFVDSLIFASQPEVQNTILDVGSGAGFPGAVAKIYNPSLQVSLMEPTGKRVMFLSALSKTLDLNLTLIKERAEEAARKQWREKYQLVTARAVAPLPQLCEYCLPLVALKGYFIAMKAKDAQQEVEASKQVIQILGGEWKENRTFTLPDGSVRELIVIEKQHNTPAKYPRNGGTIKKSPILS